MQLGKKSRFESKDRSEIQVARLLLSMQMKNDGEEQWSYVGNDFAPRPRPPLETQSTSNEIAYFDRQECALDRYWSHAARRRLCDPIGSTIEELTKNSRKVFQPASLTPNDLELREDLSRVVQFIARAR